ncbi:MAG: hypothetical protein EBT78_11510 [Betaproteobacteria bacterium]|jgi:hypothetical protein|nr:hypothetical protein [Betaproteobacteria bacterium]
MSHEDYIYINAGPGYEKVIQHDGVRTTVCENRYELLASPTAEVPEQQAVQALREWIRGRNAKVVQLSGCVSG